MNKIFGQDTLFFRIMDKIGNIIGVTLMWIVGCIPVITIGTSSIAMYYAMVKSVRRGEKYVTKEFMGAYKKNLKNGILMTLVFFMLGIVLAIDRIYVDSQDTQVAAVMSAGYTLLILVTAGLLVYIWPVMSRFSMGNWECFRLALLMVFKHLPYTVVFLALWLLGVFIIALIPVPMTFIIPGACCYVQSLLMERILRKYMPAPKTEEEMDIWYYK